MPNYRITFVGSSYEDNAHNTILILSATSLEGVASLIQEHFANLVEDGYIIHGINIEVNPDTSDRYPR